MIEEANTVLDNFDQTKLGSASEMPENSSTSEEIKSSHEESSESDHNSIMKEIKQALKDISGEILSSAFDILVEKLFSLWKSKTFVISICKTILGLCFASFKIPKVFKILFFFLPFKADSLHRLVSLLYHLTRIGSLIFEIPE